MYSRLRRIFRVIPAIVCVALILFVSSNGLTIIPPLGPALNPGTGWWTAASDAQLPHDTVWHTMGVSQSASIVFDHHGTAHITAATDTDAFYTLGYVHATYRLFQMDLMRRQGEGLLSEIVGDSALDGDVFVDKLGIQRTAQREWNAFGPSDPARQALIAYAKGVNARIQQDERTNSLPLLFKMLGYIPKPWTAVDSLVVQGDMVQSLSFEMQPLDYEMLVNKLGYQRTRMWFPVLPPDPQKPYAPGPYAAHTSGSRGINSALRSTAVRSVARLAQQLAALPHGFVHYGGNSNAWVVDGTMTASGKPMLAGDPHLHQTLPAIWYQLSVDSPHYHFSGVSIPGLPVILIGHNQRVSWSLTNNLIQQSFFYLEKHDTAHPDQYFWQGQWHRFQRINYTIPVRGAAPDQLQVDLTVHGPIITDARFPTEKISVYWTGAQPSFDLDAMLSVTQAQNFAQFRHALRLWGAPSQNFVYADVAGNIGAIAAGDYSIVKAGVPWLPLVGTGQSDVIGAIPFNNVPSVYNPPGHMIVSANQRPVSDNFPYYIGTSFDAFDNGYRADEITKQLHGRTNLTPIDMAHLQQDRHDYIASLFIPRFTAFLATTALSTQERSAEHLLQSWDQSMDQDSSAAALWWTFLSQYFHDIFDPWWNAAHITKDNFALGPWQQSLMENLEVWTLRDIDNEGFSLPNGTKRSAPQVMQQAFKEAVRKLVQQQGSDPNMWRWGALHQIKLESLSQISGLSYGPQPTGGDLWTINATDDAPISADGPSWRFIVDWGTRTAQGIYPGGQSENPASPWYEDQIPTWMNGQYYAMDNTVSDTQAIWRFEPS